MSQLKQRYIIALTVLHFLVFFAPVFDLMLLAKINTDNSDFDTVLAVYKVSSGTGWNTIEEVASNNDRGDDGQDS